MEAAITMDSLPSQPGTFRAAPLIEKKPSNKNSVKYLINEEIINLSKISHNDRDEEHRKNKELFDIRQDLSIGNEAKQQS